MSYLALTTLIRTCLSNLYSVEVNNCFPYFFISLFSENNFKAQNHPCNWELRHRNSRCHAGLKTSPTWGCSWCIPPRPSQPAEAISSFFIRHENLRLYFVYILCLPRDWSPWSWATPSPSSDWGADCQCMCRRKYTNRSQYPGSSTPRQGLWKSVVRVPPDSQGPPVNVHVGWQKRIMSGD